MGTCHGLLHVNTPEFVTQDWPLSPPLPAPRCFKEGVGWLDEVTDMRACAHPNGGVIKFPGGDPYPMGVDPVWHGTKTELPFLNSLKMKASVVRGAGRLWLGGLLVMVEGVRRP